MSTLTFLPYVGSRFETSQRRLLLLGESHYLGSDTLSSEQIRYLTQTVVERWKKREWGIRYLTIGARIITGQLAWEIDRSTVFETIAFANFVQTPMRDVRQRPTVEEARSSWGAFRELLDLHSPTHIVATGRRFLWDNMPPSDRRSGDVTLRGMLLPRREFRTCAGYADTLVIPHLSRASASKWHGPVHEFLNAGIEP